MFMKTNQEKQDKLTEKTFTQSLDIILSYFL